MIIHDLFENKTVAEGVEYSPVTQAITRRILRQRTDLLAKYGPEKVGNAIDEVADFVGDVEEIGSSDVSGWVRHVEQMLGNMQGVAEGSDAAKYYIVNHDTNENIDGPFDTREEAETVYDRMIKRVESGTMEKNFKIQKKKGVAEAIVGKPRYSEPHQSGRGLYSAADYMVRTNHQLGSHVYTAVTEVDGDNDRYYFIYEKGKKEPVFYATDMGQFEVRTDKLGNRVSNAIITAHRNATDHDLEKYISGDDESEWDQKQGVAEGSEAPTEKPAAVIKRVLGPALTWEPGHSKMYKNTRRSRTQRVDYYDMRGVELRTKFAGKMYLSSNRGDKVAVDLKDALIQAGYPVHDDLLVFGNQIMFQVRTPITTTAEQGIAEMDKSQTPPGRDGGEQFPPGPKVSKKTIKAVQKDPVKHLSDLLAKEYAKKKIKEQGVAEDQDHAFKRGDRVYVRNQIGSDRVIRVVGDQVYLEKMGRAPMRDVSRVNPGLGQQLKTAGADMARGIKGFVTGKN